MKKLTYKNSMGDELELTNTSPFLLQKFTESENVNIYNSKGMSQDGANYLGNTLDTKDMSLEFTVMAKSKEDLIVYRKKINSVFNPKLGEGYLVYKDEVKEVKVKCILNKLPFFAVINNKNNSCLISLTASNPYWQDLNEMTYHIATWLGDFEFPLELVEGGIEMGHRAPSLIVDVNNSGDVEAGMTIIFRALATLTNPSLFDVNTREYMKINKSMVAGETIIIDTAFGNKKIIDSNNSIETNAFMYIDLNSTFLQLAKGDNYFRYNADTGIDNLECEILFTPQYLGV